MALGEKLMESARRHVAKQKSKKDENTMGKGHDDSNVHHFEIHPAKGGHLVQVHTSRKMHDGYTTHDHDKSKDSIHKTMGGAAKHMMSMCECGNCSKDNQEETEEMTGGDSYSKGKD